MIYHEFIDIPRRRYKVIYLDPAWRFRTYSPQDGRKGNRGAERHYRTMTEAEMRELPVGEIAAKDCWMMMWCTWPHLESGLRILKHYGFKYSSSFEVWFKMKSSFSPTRAFITVPTAKGLPQDFHIGTGYTTRKNTEFILLGRKGSPRRLAKDIAEPIFEPVREHSRKPDRVISDIERFAVGPYIELNARTARENWDSWGDQVEMFDPPAPLVLESALFAEEQPSLLAEPRVLHLTPENMPEGIQGTKMTQAWVDELTDVNIPAFLRRLAN